MKTFEGPANTCGKNRAQRSLPPPPECHNSSFWRTTSCSSLTSIDCTDRYNVSSKLGFQDSFGRNSSVDPAASRNPIATFVPISVPNISTSAQCPNAAFVLASVGLPATEHCSAPAGLSAATFPPAAALAPAPAGLPQASKITRIENCQ